MAYSTKSAKKSLKTTSGPTFQSTATGPTFQRRTKPDAHKAVAMKRSSTGATNGSSSKATQYSGRDMAKKYLQPTQKSSSARITGNVWGSGKVGGK